MLYLIILVFFFILQELEKEKTIGEIYYFLWKIWGKRFVKENAVYFIWENLKTNG